MSCLVLTLGDVSGGLVLQLGEWLGSRLLKIPDLDSSVSTSSQPLIGWVEFEIVDLRLGFECDGGRHQSIGSAILFGNVLRTMGFQVLGERSSTSP